MRQSDPSFAFAVIALTAGFAVAALAPQIFNDGDTWWHLAAGDWMLAHRAVPRQDIFTYTVAGRFWDAQEWLSEILMAAAFRLGGWSGLHILFGLAFGATAAIVAGTLRRWMDTIPALLMTVMGIACVGGSLLARPHILALPLLALWTAVLVDARARRKAPPLWLGAVMLVWVNLHGSFAFGLALAGALAIEAIVESGDRRATARRWGIFLGLGILSAIATPQGLAGLLFPLKLLALPDLASIGEWASSDLSHLSAFLLALLTGIFALMSGRIKIPAVRALIILLLVYEAMAHARHQMLFGVVAPLLAAPAVGVAWPAQTPRFHPWPARVAGLCLALVLLFVLIRPARRGEDPVTPLAALAHVPQALRDQPVLNAYEYGGYLIFRGVKVFIDSRAELFPSLFLRNYGLLAAGNPDALASTLGRDHIAWTIFPAASPAVAALDRMRGWHRTYTDGNAVIHQRDAVSR